MNNRRLRVDGQNQFHPDGQQIVVNREVRDRASAKPDRSSKRPKRRNIPITLSHGRLRRVAGMSDRSYFRFRSFVILSPGRRSMISAFASSSKDTPGHIRSEYESSSDAAILYLPGGSPVMV